MTDYLLAEFKTPQLTPGQPFEAFTHGSFTDSQGRPTQFTREDLAAFVANTKALLKRLSARAGYAVGLPIDAAKHDHGDAAGWIMDVNLSPNGEYILFTPQWTELGLEKLGKGIQRLFSASLDLGRKVFLGGTLTNWPALGDLLKPIELSAQQEGGALLYHYMWPDEALEEYAYRVRQAFDDQCCGPARDKMMGMNATPMGGMNDEMQDMAESASAFVRSVHEGYALVQKGDKLYRAEYKDDGKAITFDPEENWQEVRLVPTPVPTPPTGDITEESMPEDTATTPAAPVVTPPAAPPPPAEFDVAQIEADVRAKVITELAQAIGISGAGDVEQNAEALKARLAALNVSNIVDLSSARDQLLAGVKDVMAQEYERIKAQGGQIVAQMMQEFQRDRTIHEYAMAITEGHQGNRYGLPVQTGRVEAFLRGLNQAQFTEAVAILGEVARTGVVDFAAMGTTGSGRFRHPLPEQIATQLDRGELTLADLSSPIIKPLLSKDLSEYDLSKWQGGK